MSMSPGSILFDANGNPIAATPASALASTQSALVTVGSDYATTAAARIPKIDSLGQNYSVPVAPGGTVLPLGVNTAVGSGTSYGQVSLAWDATNNYWRPFQVDATGAGVVRNALAATIAFSPTAQVNTTANAGKNMLSVYNGSTTLVQRVLGFYMMCPPQAAVSGGLLGTSTTYTTVGMATYRFTTAHTGGTLLTGVLHDTRDSYDSNFTCRVGATVSGTLSQSLYTFDAANSALAAYGHREDSGVKVWTLQPGEGLTFQCISAVGGSGVNFYVRVVCAQNVA